jgi:hypothetical protein
LGSPKILIFGESGGIGCPFIKRSGINPCKPIVERDEYLCSPKLFLERKTSKTIYIIELIFNKIYYEKI